MNVAGLAYPQVTNKVQQRASHAALCQDVSGVPAPRVGSRSGLLDAIIVPASRPASYLQPAIDLAARLGILLVVLCSKQTKAMSRWQIESGLHRGRERWSSKSQSSGATRTFQAKHPAECSGQPTQTDKAT